MARKRRSPAGHITCEHCRKDFKAVTARHLSNMHGYDGDHPINDYKRKFGIQSATCAESRKKISVAKESFWAKRGQHWTRASVLAEIRRVHEAGRSLRCNGIPVRLYEAGRRCFGTWESALQKAGLNYEEATGVRRWTPERIVEAIRELAERGESLSAGRVERHHPTLFNAAVKQFPRSWTKAIRAAGLNPDDYKVFRGRWDRQKAEDWVRRRNEKGKSILARAAPHDLFGFIHRRLQTTWTEFVESLGIAYAGVKKRRDWTKQKLISEIRRWKKEGHRLNYRSVKLEYQALIQQARKFFGAWDLARAAAGL